MHACLAAIAREMGVEVRAIGGTGDHVHLLMWVPPRMAVANIVRTLKADSSKWMNEEDHLFAWQQGYRAFSVSVSNLKAVEQYIARQEEHHRKRSYAEEFREFLKKHGIETASGREME